MKSLPFINRTETRPDNSEMSKATDASAEAVHAAKHAAQATETAREAQLQEVIEATAVRTKEALIEGLKEVFGQGDDLKNDGQMVVLIRRIPILCTNVQQMHADIAEIKSNILWAVRMIIGAVILAVLALVFK